MDADETRAWARLLRLTALGGRHAARLLDAFGSAAAAVDAGPAAWERIGFAKLHAALSETDASLVDADLAWLAAPEHHLLTLTDPRYPARLREIDAFPPALYAIGEPKLLELPSLAIVGSRSPTPQGAAIAADFASELSRHGLVITSGLASGIDAAAHRGCLSAGGLTTAVCATGLDRVYPASHRELAHQIGAQGLLVSEFPLGTRPRANFFPRRNRIISGVSLGVLVVEAAQESGSLITARLAIEQGRDVFAIPGSIHNPLARGCHQLIRSGAKLVEQVADIIDELRPQLAVSADHLRDRSDASFAPTPAPEDPGLAQLLDALGWDACTTDDVAMRHHLDPGALASGLLRLELEGWITTMPDGRLMRLPRSR